MNSLEHIIGQYFLDKYGNPQSEHITKDYQISAKYNLVQLEGYLDEHEQIEIDGFYRVYNFDEITENSFYVRNAKTIYFHPSQRGKFITIDWHCIGIEYLNIDSIYTDKDSEGNVIRTLGSFIDDIKDSINTLKDLKDIEELVPLLEKDFIRGGQLHNSLEMAIIKVENLLYQLDTKIEMIKKLTNEK